MHAWLAAAADQRIFATAAVAGVQGFGWAIQNNAFQVNEKRMLQTRFAFTVACIHTRDSFLFRQGWTAFHTSLRLLLRTWVSPGSTQGP